MVVVMLIDIAGFVVFAQGPVAYQFAPLLLILAAFYFIMVLPQRRKEQEHRRLLDALKKDDRVVTMAGIYGVVANVRREADRITLKVDEATNTKIDVTFGSIARVVTDEPSGEKNAR